MATNWAYNRILRGWSTLIWVWKYITGQIKKERIEKARRELSVKEFVKIVKKPSIVEVIIGPQKKRRPARVIKENYYTIWVELPNGDIIKRHKLKHVVRDGFVSYVQRGQYVSYEQIEKYANA